MNWKKLWSNLIWIAALVFLAWYFLWPVSLAKVLPENEGLRVTAMEYDEAGNVVQTEYILPIGTDAHSALRTAVEEYACYRTLNLNDKHTSQNFVLERQYLIQPDSGTSYLYTYGANTVNVNDDVLRMGWFNNKQAQAFVEEVHGILTADGTGVVVESREILETAPEE